MLRRAIRFLFRCSRAFAADRAASVTVDFIVSIPILLAVLVLTTEYGKILNTRTVLDNAVADATRYLTRVPLVDNQFPAASIDIAQTIVRSRLNTDLVNVSQPTVNVNLIDGLTTVRLDAAVGVESPALSVLSLISSSGTLSDGTKLADIEGFVIVASETFRHFGR